MLWQYIRGLFHHWVVVLTATILAVASPWLPKLFSRQPEPLIGLLVLLVAIPIAGFFAWRDERIARRAAEQRLTELNTYNFKVIPGSYVIVDSGTFKTLHIPNVIVSNDSPSRGISVTYSVRLGQAPPRLIIPATQDIEAGTAHTVGLDVPLKAEDSLEDVVVGVWDVHSDTVAEGRCTLLLPST